MVRYWITSLALVVFFIAPVFANTDLDSDHDGVPDKDEINIYKTDPLKADTDGDGFKDWVEINSGYDPLKGGKARLEKIIKINIKNQELEYFFGKVKLNAFKVSTGKRSMPTPKGEFKILNKSPKAWSRDYGLWMPYWLGLGKFGIHELPIWPNGYREGANHLGIPVSHGCIRLGIGPAKTLYDWAEMGTRVVIE
jgi:hypothetical protein